MFVYLFNMTKPETHLLVSFILCVVPVMCPVPTGLADDNAKVQAAAANMLNLALTLPDAPADLSAVLVRSRLNHLRHVCNLFAT